MFHEFRTCITCSKVNKRRRHPKQIPQVYFDTAGVYYKRTYAIVKVRRDIPQCIKCFTDADYKPPLASAHLFPHNSNPNIAFGNYPIKVFNMDAVYDLCRTSTEDPYNSSRSISSICKSCLHFLLYGITFVRQFIAVSRCTILYTMATITFNRFFG